MPRGPKLEPYIRERIYELKRSAKWGAKRIQKNTFPDIPRSTIHYTLRVQKVFPYLALAHLVSLLRRTETVYIIQFKTALILPARICLLRPPEVAKDKPTLPYTYLRYEISYLGFSLSLFYTRGLKKGFFGRIK
ncbi:uncharacterized protein N7477_005244 [Penicillium maclennaniae]|uniref:uncharacterized protein n=1 Tax=Penicillium maclennaniae TaxID=1343394 RepID=UPI0025404C96|nr:uncharacterized protein N7477_005244 [Penicillium maclennaniae]KAJ5675310.1 hypothetical protein N7477_005244 [Penicillium maclennaniae]